MVANRYYDQTHGPAYEADGQSAVFSRPPEWLSTREPVTLSHPLVSAEEAEALYLTTGYEIRGALLLPPTNTATERLIWIFAPTRPAEAHIPLVHATRRGFAQRGEHHPSFYGDPEEAMAISNAKLLRLATLNQQTRNVWPPDPIKLFPQWRERELMQVGSIRNARSVIIVSPNGEMMTVDEGAASWYRARGRVAAIIRTDPLSYNVYAQAGLPGVLLARA